MTAPRGTTYHPCVDCGAIVTVAGYPDPAKPVLCVGITGMLRSG